MTAWIIIWISILLAGMVLLLVLYAKLLRDLDSYNPAAYTILGRPTLFMYSPRRGLLLQEFVYSGSRRPGIHPSVARLCRLLGVLTPVYVCLLLGVLMWGTSDYLFYL